MKKQVFGVGFSEEQVGELLTKNSALSKKVFIRVILFHLVSISLTLFGDLNETATYINLAGTAIMCILSVKELIESIKEVRASTKRFNEMFEEVEPGHFVRRNNITEGQE